MQYIFRLFYAFFLKISKKFTDKVKKKIISIRNLVNSMNSNKL